MLGSFRPSSQVRKYDTIAVVGVGRITSLLAVSFTICMSISTPGLARSSRLSSWRPVSLRAVTDIFFSLKPSTHTTDADETQLSSWVASAVWTHPSAAVTQFTMSCAVELLRLVTSDYITTSLLNKKAQQSWQTSALAVHLPVARWVSIIPCPFCLHPSSSIVILVFYLFSTGISEQHVWEMWVWIQFTGMTLRLRVTPMNNPITLISPV